MSTLQFPLRLPHEFLMSNGRWIFGASGKTYIFHGVNMINKLPPYTLSATGFDTRSAQLLADNGLNVVRVGVIYSAVEPAPGVYDDDYLGKILETVNVLSSCGIMSLIDFHQDGWGPLFNCEGFPDWATFTGNNPIRPIGNFPKLCENPAVKTAFDNFWADAKGPGGISLQTRYQNAWAHAAQVLSAPGKLANPYCILGWELMNEPFPSSIHTTDKLLTDFTQRLVNAVRKADPNRMIWYEPWVTFDEGTPTFMGQINDQSPRRIGFAFHNYGKGPFFETVWHNAREHSGKYGDALLATEFGNAKPKPVEIVIQMDSADKAMMPVIYWTYSNRTPYVIEFAGEIISSSEQGVVYDPALPLRGVNVNHDVLEALCRPYPMSVGGTPKSWVYRPLTKEFELTYAPKAGGAVIFVPHCHYPNGIEVVPGRFKWSLDPTNPQLLVISNEIAAPEVTVKFSRK
jgi:endoglycosylceramidase